jgi:hypothetical protein
MSMREIAQLHALREKKRLLQELVWKQTNQIERHLESLKEIVGPIGESNAHRNAVDCVIAIYGYLDELGK